MKKKFTEFMYGRYGADELCKFLLGVCVICILLNLFTNIRGVYILSLVMLGICYYRMFSRDYSKRSAENRKYLAMTAGVRGKIEKTKRRLIQSKDFHIYKCPSCGQKIRIPRGKGRICITCPKCRTEFEKKS